MIGNEEYTKMYSCWLDYKNNEPNASGCKWDYGNKVYCAKKDIKDPVISTALIELSLFFREYYGLGLVVTDHELDHKGIMIQTANHLQIGKEGYKLSRTSEKICIEAEEGRGILYGVFRLILHIKRQLPIEKLHIIEAPANEIRMINHWDNSDGSIERGYAGQSLFFHNNKIVKDTSRIRDYARLLASVGINSISINNVNVHQVETRLITTEYLKELRKISRIFTRYGIKLFLSVNFAAPMELSNLDTADPLNPEVKEWWKEAAKTIYSYIPEFGGFLVKADSENRPGPFTYNRTHAEGANMLAEALEDYKGIVIWRCFVYNCHVDWRDRKTDRAKAAYDHFKALDGKFRENVILQIKNGPMDFQIREPLSPLFGKLQATNQIMEFQITQEYTGQQKHICFLVPMWKECLDFNTYANSKEAYVKDIVSGKYFNNSHGGLAAVANVGDSLCWTGNPMAAANLYGFGKLCWNPDYTSEEIAKEWSELTLGLNPKVTETVENILLKSRKAYEDYTVPLGIGWMVNVGHHYGPNIEGYEYSPWGTYHYADYRGIGVDRTISTGTGYAEQYFEPNKSMYEHIGSCPEELLLFFHHLPYTYILKDGRTILQYIYDVHFEGAEKVKEFAKAWEGLATIIDQVFYDKVKSDLELQIKDAIEWRDVINTYFYRRTGIEDQKHRKIYS